MFKLSLFFILTLINTGLFSQKADTSMFQFRKAEAELEEIQARCFNNKNEAERIAGNKELIAAWDKFVTDPRILQYTFTKLKDISILESRDKQLKLITWNLYRNDGTHSYLGYLLVNNRKRIKKGFMKHELIESYDHYKLIDRSSTVTSPETYIGSPEKWFGMIYYEMVECDGYYTLLGYDPNDKLTRRKFVDVLSFRSNGAPVFGKDIFKFPRKNPRRLMFEYSSEVTMSLRYRQKDNMIVYSHLGAKQEGDMLKDQYQFYGPDGTFDALVLKKDKWVTIEDIDARNEKDEQDKEWNNPRDHSDSKRKKIMPGQKSK